MARHTWLSGYSVYGIRGVYTLKPTGSKRARAKHAMPIRKEDWQLPEEGKMNKDATFVKDDVKGRKFYIEVIKETYEKCFGGSVVEGLCVNVYDMEKKAIDKEVLVDCTSECNSDRREFESSNRYKVEMYKDTDKDYYVLTGYFGSVDQYWNLL
jgi:hypothetical protein